MSAAPRSAGSSPGAPAIDEGEPGSLVAVVLEAMAPSWGRLHSTLLVLVPMLVVLAIWETFRLPQPAIACFILLMLSRGDAVSTMASAVLLSSMVATGALLAVLVLAFSLSQPALRIPVMALMTFTTMLLVRATTLGPVAFVAGFFATYGTTQADSLQSLAASTGDVTNTEGFGRPQIDYFPPEEALLHALLWLTMVALVPALLLFVANRLAGPDPRRLLLARFHARSDAAIAYCRDAPGGTDRLHEVAREGIAPLLELLGPAERAHRLASLHDVHLRLTRAFNRLILLLVAWDMARHEAGSAGRADFLGDVAGFVAALRARLGQAPDAGRDRLALPPPGSEDMLEGALPSLAAEIRRVLERLRDAEAERSGILRHGAPRPATQPRPALLQKDAFGAPNIRFALKVTLTVMTAYLLESGLDWQGISTCVVTCFFVALNTIGETVHKMTLRIAGCLIGAVLGIGSILLLMPSMTGFAQLAILFGAVAFASIWVAFGSLRVSYAGWQMLLAFALTTLQGYGPTLDMQTARDRVVGILVGNLVTTLVFAFVWPVRVGDSVRVDMAEAAETLGGLMSLEGDGALEERRAREGELRDGFVAAVARAGGVIPNDRFEPHPSAAGGRIGRAALARFARLVVPVSVIATDGVEPSQRDEIPQPLRDEVRDYHRAMAGWFGQAAAWIRTGEGRDRLRASLPRLPATLDPSIPDLPASIPSGLLRRIEGRAALYRLLERQIDEFVDSALPAEGGAGGPATSGRRASLAAT